MSGKCSGTYELLAIGLAAMTRDSRIHWWVEGENLVTDYGSVKVTFCRYHKEGSDFFSYDLHTFTEGNSPEGESSFGSMVPSYEELFHSIENQKE